MTGGGHGDEDRRDAELDDVPPGHVHIIGA
jgi:hypothetical protein